MLSRSSRCVRLVGHGFALVPVSGRAWRAGVLPETVELPMKEGCKESVRSVESQGHEVVSAPLDPQN